MEKEEDDLQPFAHNDGIARPEDHLGNGSDQRQKGRVLTGLDVPRLVEQTVPLAFGYGSAKHIVDGPVPAQVERPGHSGQPKDDSHNGQRDERKKGALERILRRRRD
jgi:hypothetical protein